MISQLEPSIIYKIVTCWTKHFGPFYVIRMTTLNIEWACQLQAFKHPTDDILHLNQMPSILNHLFITATLKFGISSYNKTAIVRLRRSKFQGFYWVQLWRYLFSTDLSEQIYRSALNTTAFLWTISNVLIWAKKWALNTRFIWRSVYTRITAVLKLTQSRLAKTSTKQLIFLKNVVAETGFGLIGISYWYVHCKTLRYVLWVRINRFLSIQNLYILEISLTRSKAVEIRFEENNPETGKCSQALTVGMTG